MSTSNEMPFTLLGPKATMAARACAKRREEAREAAVASAAERARLVPVPPPAPRLDPQPAPSSPPPLVLDGCNSPVP
jgi:hypothetical protein